eukprot:COSAG02_NODE_3668_length_6398_cov_3.344975_1_plen_160_part_00
MFKTRRGLKQHVPHCIAIDAIWEDPQDPRAGWDLAPSRPLRMRRGVPPYRFWLVSWVDAQGKPLPTGDMGNGRPDVTGAADWQPEKNLMRGKFKMITKYFEEHPGEDPKQRVVAVDVRRLVRPMTDLCNNNRQQYFFSSSCRFVGGSSATRAAWRRCGV